MGKFSEDSIVLPGPYYINRELGIEPEIAENVTVNGLIDCIHKIIIEKDVFFGHDIMLLTGGHDYTKFGEDRKRVDRGGPIIIREGVWIATRAIIIGPCEIGRHSVIGAGSVVSKDIPEFQVWAGNPIQFIKTIEHA